MFQSSGNDTVEVEDEALENRGPIIGFLWAGAHTSADGGGEGVDEAACGAGPFFAFGRGGAGHGFCLSVAGGFGSG